MARWHIPSIGDTLKTRFGKAALGWRTCGRLTTLGVHAREPYVHMVAAQILLAVFADQFNQKPSSVHVGRPCAAA